MLSRDTLSSRIFNVSRHGFVDLALEVFAYQLQHNPLYRDFVTHRCGAFPSINSLSAIPFLPISFFKTHQVQSFEGQPEAIFTSSGTTGITTSRHAVASLQWYEQCFTHAFSLFYGLPSQYAFLCLLPSYLEREGSSLIYMANALVRQSLHAESGFFLQADAALLQAIEQCRERQIPAILLGVTFALLDFADRHAGLDLRHLIVMETGGMKGRRVEMLRVQVHQQLTAAFQLPAIHSEYGMTEMMSQAYAKTSGRYYPPPWVRVLVRSEEDPLEVSTLGRGMLCIIDLANLDSCAFLETADMGHVFEDGSFEVLGRIDHSDMRGCSLLTL